MNQNADYVWDFYAILHRNLGIYSSKGYTSVTTSVAKRKPTFLYIQATRISATIFYILVQRQSKRDRKSISGNVSEDDARSGNRSRDLFPRNSNVGSHHQHFHFCTELIEMWAILCDVEKGQTKKKCQGTWQYYVSKYFISCPENIIKVLYVNIRIYFRWRRHSV